MARKRKVQFDFSLTDNKLKLLFKASLHFKSKCKFQEESWESKKSKYENILDNMLKEYSGDMAVSPPQYFPWLFSEAVCFFPTASTPTEVAKVPFERI